MEKLSTPSANRFRFRAWDTEDKQMIYPSWDGNKIVSLCVYPDGFPNEKWEMLQCEKDKHYEIWITKSSRGFLMQSTGLLDKNGKELWEGEILEEKERGTPFVCRGVIEWRDAAWMVHLFCTASRKPDYVGHDLGWYFVHERIQPRMNDDPAVSVGNRYENPDLLPSA